MVSTALRASSNSDTRACSRDHTASVFVIASTSTSMIIETITMVSSNSTSVKPRRTL